MSVVAYSWSFFLIYKYDLNYGLLMIS